MKRFTLVALVFVLALLTATIAIAGPLDAVKEWVVGAGAGAIALGLTALIGLLGLATRAKWVSAVFFALDFLFVAIGAVFGALGLMLQDGKIEAMELANAWDKIGNIPDRAKAFIAVLKAGKAVDGDGA
jgi:hypothetical protein